MFSLTSIHLCTRYIEIKYIFLSFFVGGKKSVNSSNLSFPCSFVLFIIVLLVYIFQMFAYIFICVFFLLQNDKKHEYYFSLKRGVGIKDSLKRVCVIGGNLKNIIEYNIYFKHGQYVLFFNSTHHFFRVSFPHRQLCKKETNHTSK